MMTRTMPGLTLGLLLALSAFRWSAAADEPSGFRPLFDGKSLNGWVTPDDKSLFTVEDGAIVGRTQGNLKKKEFLVTDQSYGNFVLKAKVKIRNHNSGIQFRSRRAPDGAVSGPQADVADGFWGLLYEERGRGILERFPADKAKELVRKGDWNDFVITAHGDRVTIDLNGTRVIDRTDPKFSRTGVIALQVHVGPPMEVRYKDVEIKVLD
jgi:hypothetical protein